MNEKLVPENSPLGRATAYRSDYAPELLFPIPRKQKRDELGLDEAALPFTGEDLWNAYEISWLNPRGKPVVALGEFRVPAHSPRLIESKSLKLYLNSFNQTRMTDAEAVSATLARDLSQAAGASVRVSVQPLERRPRREIDYLQGECIDALDIEVAQYSPQPSLLRADPAQLVEGELLCSHLLKSNCLVTGQPDWGMVALRYSGPRIEREALLRYIISFREHNEFHEQCVERIFTDVLTRCAPRELAVWARYTRRGGLDINPFRSNRADWRAENLFEVRQ
ncbi:NADPH-dependent 7-cyano-7-deazaguanine reductase QueF [Uliginosibacterium sp. 31-12]|uniref:NADPH-dependent 7-cyano-7-deazaguanine reductase QueF n=1 Tax=Uliginosibacterium sp. 31-12 TaxID=3062781 RepID=UPI0026E1CCC7|nr:NADPH-dependent 7-cyano-7-deazaguanine reductase QueF [Uliginosibacterium sp. 31-12]MDO6385806.1 NADPH-dependent 7-cyano-7-deazaguanine reductase QueF [Uliginosibacterium sp. 31-12]